MFLKARVRVRHIQFSGVRAILYRLQLLDMRLSVRIFQIKSVSGIDIEQHNRNQEIMDMLIKP